MCLERMLRALSAFVAMREESAAERAADIARGVEDTDETDAVGNRAVENQVIADGKASQVVTEIEARCSNLWKFGKETRLILQSPQQACRRTGIISGNVVPYLDEIPFRSLRA